MSLTLNKRAIAKEWLVALVCFVLGAVWAVNLPVRDYWLPLLLPYCAVQLLRFTWWALGAVFSRRVVYSICAVLAIIAAVIGTVVGIQAVRQAAEKRAWAIQQAAEERAWKDWEYAVHLVKTAQFKTAKQYMRNAAKNWRFAGDADAALKAQATEEKLTSDKNAPKGAWGADDEIHLPGDFSPLENFVNPVAVESVPKPGIFDPNKYVVENQKRSAPFDPDKYLAGKQQTLNEWDSVNTERLKKDPNAFVPPPPITDAEIDAFLKGGIESPKVKERDFGFVPTTEFDRLIPVEDYGAWDRFKRYDYLAKKYLAYLAEGQKQVKGEPLGNYEVLLPPSPTPTPGLDSSKP